jgi:hypothetical protein
MKEATFRNKYFESQKRVRALELEKTNAWVMLPFITDEIYDEFKDTGLIEVLDRKCNWTQDAVEFACLISPQKELSQLTHGVEK